MGQDFDHNGYRARWVCDREGTKILWLHDPGDGITPGGWEPYGEDTCTCPWCKRMTAPTCTVEAAA